MNNIRLKSKNTRIGSSIEVPEDWLNMCDLELRITPKRKVDTMKIVYHKQKNRNTESLW